MCRDEALPPTGRQVRLLSAPEVKQIAGRAGRFGSAHPVGHVTCLHQKDQHLLHEAMGTQAVPLERACLWPRWVWDEASGTSQRKNNPSNDPRRAEDLAAWSTRHPGMRFDDALERYTKSVRLSDTYFLGDHSNMIKLASMLNVGEQYTCRPPLTLVIDSFSRLPLTARVWSDEP